MTVVLDDQRKNAVAPYACVRQDEPINAVVLNSGFPIRLVHRQLLRSRNDVHRGLVQVSTSSLNSLSSAFSHQPTNGIGINLFNTEAFARDTR